MSSESPTYDRTSVVYIVDDDKDLRNSLVFVLKNAGMTCIDFGDPFEFLEKYDNTIPGCCLFDMQMEGMNGIELAKLIKVRGKAHPVIFLTGHGTIENAVDAIRLGATDYLEKPIDHNRLLVCIRKAIRDDYTNRLEAARTEELVKRIETLSAREKEVMDLVADGLLTKQIAAKLNISQKTVDVHRSNVNRKMGVQSVAQLVKILAEQRKD